MKRMSEDSFLGHSQIQYCNVHKNIWARLHRHGRACIIHNLVVTVSIFDVLKLRTVANVSKTKNPPKYAIGSHKGTGDVINSYPTFQSQSHTHRYLDSPPNREDYQPHKAFRNTMNCCSGSPLVNWSASCCLVSIDSTLISNSSILERKK